LPQANTESGRRSVAARFFAVPTMVVLSSCANFSVSTAIQNQAFFGGRRFCSADLALPDVPDNDGRRKFEDKMVQVGVLTRTSAVRGATFHRAVYDVSPSASSSIIYILRPTATHPGVARVCFGHLHVASILETMATSNSTSVVRFRYQVDLSPWAQTLYPYLHLSRTGLAYVYVRHTDDPRMPYVVGGLRVIEGSMMLRFVMFPPDGRNWYPHGFPVDVCRIRICTV